MNLETRNLILSAWRENRLVAVHVDLIDAFFNYVTSPAFEGVRKNADLMRSLNIPNIWVTFDTMGIPFHKHITTVAEMDTDLENRIADDVAAHPEEIVVVKDEIPAFKRHEDTGLSVLLDRLQADTILIDGVYSGGCVNATICEGIIKNAYNFVAIPEGMDWQSLRQGQDHLSRLQEFFEEDYSDKIPRLRQHLFTATRGDIKTTLTMTDDTLDMKGQNAYSKYNI